MKQIIERLRNNFYQRIFDERAFDLYISPQGGSTQNSQSTFPMEDKIQKLINGSDMRSLLILANPGFGKTLLSYQVAHCYWQQQPNNSAISIVPIWIYLPTINKKQRDKSLLETSLEHYGLLVNEIDSLRKVCQNQDIQLLIILDGLDEIRMTESNFYLSNRWFEDWGKLKVITFSRPEAFLTLDEPVNYQRLFYSQQLGYADPAFIELWLQPFSENDINQYLQGYVKQLSKTNNQEIKEMTPRGLDKDWSRWETYRDTLIKITPLARLAQNPFILSIMVQAIPTIIQQASKDEHYLYTRERVYYAFVQHWLNQKTKRIWDNTQHREALLKAGLGDETQLTECLWTYSQNLARFVWEESQGKLDKPLFEENTLQPELVVGGSEASLHQTKDVYFRENDLNNTVLAIIRSGCLLKCQGNAYRFLHKTITEFLAARALFNSVHNAAEAYLKNQALEGIKKKFSLNKASLLPEPQIIYLLADIANTHPKFKEQLYQILEYSKQEHAVATAAANAITVLNVAGELFNNKDFRGIQIPGADLTGAICDSTNFAHANLSSVCLENAWLRSANLNETNLTHAKFGILPSIYHNKYFTTMTIDPDKKILFAGDMSGTITTWNLETCQLISSWKAQAIGYDVKLGGVLGFMPISALTLSPSRTKLAYATFDGIVHVCNLGGSKMKHLISTTAKARESMSAERIGKINFLPQDEQKILFNTGQPFLKDDDPTQGLSIWDCRTGKPIESFDGVSPYASHDLSPDGRYLACSKGSKEALVVYDLTKPKTTGPNDSSMTPHGVVFKNHFKADGYLTYQFSPRGTLLACLRQRGWSEKEKEEDALYIYSTDPWHLVNTIRATSVGEILSQSFIFLPNEQFVLCEGSASISLWHIESGNCLHTLPCVSGISSGTDLSNSAPIVLEKPTLRAYSLRNQVVYTFDIDVVDKFFTRKINPLFTEHNWVQQGNFLDLGSYYEKHPDQQLGDLTIHYKGEAHEKSFDTTTQVLTQITVTKNNSTIYQIEFIHGYANFAGEKMALLLSNNQQYLIFTLIDTYGFEGLYTLPAPKVLGYLGGKGSDSLIRVFDLTTKKQSFTFAHHNQIISMIFSTDSKWLVTAGFTVRIWEMATGKCLHQYKFIDKWADAIALNHDKSLLAIFDGGRNLKLYNTTTHELVFELKAVTQRVRKLQFSVDDKYLLCTPETKQHFIYKIIRFDQDKLILQLDEQMQAANFYCEKANVQGAIVNNTTQFTLFRQLGAYGTPSQTTKALITNDNTSLEKSLFYAKPIVETFFYSLIQPKFPLTYESWVVSLLRDAKSEHPEHTFLVVEGINAWGRLLLLRYDLATTVQGKPIKSGFAQIVIKMQQGLNYEVFQDALLHQFLKVKNLSKLNDIEGQAWSITREQALILHKNILAEKEGGLVVYSQVGKESFFSSGHNCYTFCRAHLLRLGHDKIKQELPVKTSDYIGTHPYFHLNQPPSQSSEQIKQCSIM